MSLSLKGKGKAAESFTETHTLSSSDTPEIFDVIDGSPDALNRHSTLRDSEVASIGRDSQDTSVMKDSDDEIPLSPHASSSK